MLHKLLEQRLQQAVAAVLPDAGTANLLVRPCPDPKFGDYQSNALMSVAKERKMNPRQLAEQVKAKLDVADLCESVEIAGAGFLNFRLKNSAITDALSSAARGEHLFFQKTNKPRTVVVDFSSPNVAKPMHVGHIRSTILGDSLARVLRLLGHKVITDNHIGDWGTQFGKLLVGWKNLLNKRKLKQDAIAELERLYKIVNFVSEVPPSGSAAVFQSLSFAKYGVGEISAFWQQVRHLPDEQFANRIASDCTERDFGIGGEATLRAVLQALQKLGILDRKSNCIVPKNEIDSILKAVSLALRSQEQGSSVLEVARRELVKLQSGNNQNLKIWREMIALSQHQFDTIYGRLGVKFDHTLGESFYNPWLKEVVTELQQQKLAQESEGAQVVFFEEIPELKGQPAIIQKSDGGFNYATTDLATLRYRLQTWQPAEIVYVTDGRQQLHFKQIFATFRRWHPEAQMKLAHVWFGSILGEDGKPFKTRSGDTVKLADLLDEAEERAFNVVAQKNADLSDADKKEIARIVGIGSVKYADLQQNRQSDYIFSWDKMLSLQGNTAPYLQYAYTRVRSIFRKAGEQNGDAAKTVVLTTADEMSLAKHLLNFGLVLENMAEEYRPNYLCSYLYELAGHFARFYESSPVLKAEEPQRSSRLVLCDLTARVLKQGLDVLGIQTSEQM